MADPCGGVDCGAHGTCSSGTCICENSGAYTGDRCQNYDSCVGVDCGANGICSSGTCFCESGYTGGRCTDDAMPVILLIVLVACSTVAALCWHKRKQLFSKNEAGEGIYDSTGAPPPADSETL